MLTMVFFTSSSLKILELKLDNNQPYFLYSKMTNFQAKYILKIVITGKSERKTKPYDMILIDQSAELIGNYMI